MNERPGNTAMRDGFWSAVAPELRRALKLHRLEPDEIDAELRSPADPLPRERIKAIVATAASDTSRPSTDARSLSPRRLLEELSSSGAVPAEELRQLVDDADAAGSFDSAEDFAGALQKRELIRPHRPDGQEQRLQAGMLLDGYLLLNQIGVGGMGEVFRAVHLAMNREVALKVVRPVRKNLKRFRGEAQNIARLNHPNVVAGYHAGKCHDVPYLVMEFVDGSDLARLVERLGPLATRLVVDYTLQAARGLDYVHQRSLVHRDVKPSNMLVDGDGVLRISDLGLAKYLPQQDAEQPTDVTAPGAPVGTYAYMSPEQARGDTDLTGRSDVYGLGCSLFYLLVGRPPSDGTTRGELLRWHREGVVPSLRDYADDLPEGLDELFQSMLSKSAQGRPSMAEVVRRLEKLSDEERAASPAVQPTRRPTTVPAWQWLSLFGALILVPLSLMIDWPGGDRQAPPAGDGRRALTPPPPLPPELAEQSILINTLGMKLMPIPAGQFLMGAPAFEEGSLEAERPQHLVRISRPFFLGAHEVTRGQWNRVMHPDLAGSPPLPAGAADAVNEDNLPVVDVSWQEAADFCLRLSQLAEEREAGRSYRLPTEAEWEYACRAGTDTPFSTGDDLTFTQANFGAEWRPPDTKLPGAPRVFEVGSLPPNPFGLHDMHGNVLEWCRDKYGEYHGGEEVDPRGAKIGDGRVVRGGATMYQKSECRSAFRRWKRPDERNPRLGFRVVCEIGNLE